jgi:hypothetical protein
MGLKYSKKHVREVVEVVCGRECLALPMKKSAVQAHMGTRCHGRHGAFGGGGSQAALKHTHTVVVATLMPRTAEYVFTTEPGVSKPNTSGARRDSTCREEEENIQEGQATKRGLQVRRSQQPSQPLDITASWDTPIVTSTEQLIEISS